MPIINKQQYISWLLGLAVSVIAIVVWLSGIKLTGLNTYSWFPLFGLLAWSLMWTHYIYGVMMVRWGFDRSPSYKRVSELVVLACILLHPGLLAYQLWIDKGQLPPFSTISYLGQASTLLIIASYAALLAFLSYDVLVRVRKRPFWQRNWFWVSLSQALAMIIIYFHAIKLGSHMQVDWFSTYWLLLGLLLAPSIVYLLYKDLPNTWKIKIYIRSVMNNKKLTTTLGVIILLVVGAAAYFGLANRGADSVPPANAPTNQSSSQPSSSGGITLAEVEKNNGQNGAKCWVIVDGVVYEISGFAQWVDGLHTPSGGRARCGKDLSNVIDQASHARSVLKLLTVVGQQN